ncbi:hypothetical protein FN846DRAFT_940258 [Sphaerosporella brunnea]|uniref:Amidoligase enzyme-domain-containing protein n=1 Tax=Sphaerosporella brunnea TaxID=1250544 RepID=A0A5J5F1I1_9PEZI|nr:hypothetical protein FN846DRAFT_940258 [Sphaerosporella brunnea]
MEPDISTKTAAKFLRLYGKKPTSNSDAWLIDINPEEMYEASKTANRINNIDGDDEDDYVNDFETIEAHLKSVLLQHGHRETRVIPKELRHDPRLTFGLELEMVINRKPKDTSDRDEGLRMLLKSFEKLNSILPRQFPAEMYWKGSNGPKMCGEPDRTKFLIQRDESIRNRIKPKIPIVLPKAKTDPVLASTAQSIKQISALWKVPKGKWGWEQPVDHEKPLSPAEEKSKWDVIRFTETSPSTRVVEFPTEKQIRDDYLNSLDDRKFILGVPVEVCTPIMTQKTYKYLLRKSLHWMPHDMPLHFGESMGLHVHVGCGVNKTWNLAELKAIAKGVILWEAALDAYHAEWRRKGTWMCTSNRNSPLLKDLTVLDCFAKIDRTRTPKEFYRVVGDAKFQKYNFGINRTYGTIEFRQAEAHGDHERAIKWVETLSALVTGSLLTEPWEWVAWGRMVWVGGYYLRELPLAVWERFGLDAHLKASFEEKFPAKWAYGEERTRCDNDVHKGLCCYYL